MKAFRVRPRRRLRQELFSLCVAGALPLALVLAFPRRAIGFRATSSVRPREFSCAFVALDDAATHRALAAARAAWQVDSSGVRGLRTDLASNDLPPIPLRAVFDDRPSRQPSRTHGAAFVPNVLPPSVAARAPEPIAPDGDRETSERKPAFSSEEMLELH